MAPDRVLMSNALENARQLFKGAPETNAYWSDLAAYVCGRTAQAVDGKGTTFLSSPFLKSVKGFQKRSHPLKDADVGEYLTTLVNAPSPKPEGIEKLLTDAATRLERFMPGKVHPPAGEVDNPVKISRDLVRPARFDRYSQPRRKCDELSVQDFEIEHEIAELERDLSSEEHKEPQDQDEIEKIKCDINDAQAKQVALAKTIPSAEHNEVVMRRRAMGYLKKAALVKYVQDYRAKLGEEPAGKRLRYKDDDQETEV
ncbi:hypothetical protein SCUCBS95973_005736 [Sporothrix curviconia]|uniref:Uncharacterized protein n=1 Tax=Sporothrix curviconia TaxID=1260050 RepID=A0ABP0BZN5_9PEZI